MPTTPLGTILAELLQASSGIRADGGTTGCLYVGISDLILQTKLKGRGKGRTFEVLICS